MSFVTKEEIIQYCLNQGIGITYESEDVFDVITCRTTDTETKKAEKECCSPRYVHENVFGWFLNHPRQSQVAYAVENNLCSIDFDEWQAIQNILGIEMSWETALAINNVLYEGLDLRPVDIPVVDYEDLWERLSKYEFITEFYVLRELFSLSSEETEKIETVIRILNRELGVSLYRIVLNRINIPLKSILPEDATPEMRIIEKIAREYVCVNTTGPTDTEGHSWIETCVYDGMVFDSIYVSVDNEMRGEFIRAIDIYCQMNNIDVNTENELWDKLLGI